MTAASIFFILAAICMIGVVLSLFGGLLLMGRGKEKDAQYSNKMMRYRIMLQGGAILFLILASWAK